YLAESNEFIDAIFETLAGTALVIIDSRMKIIRHNNVFIRLFSLPETDVAGKRLTDLDIPLGKDPHIREKLIAAFVTGSKTEIKNMMVRNTFGHHTMVDVRTKIIDTDADKKL